MFFLCNVILFLSSFLVCIHIYFVLIDLTFHIALHFNYVFRLRNVFFFLLTRISSSEFVSHSPIIAYEALPCSASLPAEMKRNSGKIFQLTHTLTVNFHCKSLLTLASAYITSACMAKFSKTFSRLQVTLSKP